MRRKVGVKMSIPDYQTFMLPFLKLLEDGSEHNFRNLTEQLVKVFNLSEEDKKEMLPSGRQYTYKSRIGWAKTYLKKAGLLKNAARGRYVITERGRQVLKNNPDYIDNDLLSQFPEFLEFRNQGQNQVNDTKSSTPISTTTSFDNNQTPEEILEASYQDIRRDLANELLEKVKSCSPSFFEQLVVDLLVAMGYGGSRSDAGKAIGRSNDEGIDGIINEDKLGLDVLYVQAKRWENTVGRPDVQAFAGSLEGQRARKGVFITTSKFSREAEEYVKIIEKKIVLIDGKRLSDLMIDYDIGVSEQARYIVKKMDTDYFEDNE